ncbi:MAG: response regulator [Candidatus Latescibacteria bacterium]|nr:response regulator [Candidatus Latescibacterota bacterium]
MTKSNSTNLCKILVIDDEESICRLLSTLLKRSNYYVETFTDSTKALQRLDEYAFDIVITDLQMPNTTGWDIAQHVKENNPKIPVILITAALSEYDEYLKELGIDYIIPKPMSIHHVLDIIKEISKVC